MAYQITRINDLEQFGELNTTYLLVDDAGIMPDVRVDKTFKINENLDRIIENDKVFHSSSIIISGSSYFMHR